jgi:hypothetical protein
MANYIRKAKSGSDWTRNELEAYNIAVDYQDSATFFGTHDLPQPAIHPAFLMATDPDEATDDDIYAVLRLMDLASARTSEQDSAVKDFAVLLLGASGYTPRGRVLRTMKDIPLVICGEVMDTQVDVCVTDRHEIFLLVQEDQCLALLDPEAQLIAKAIAAFAANNLTRQKTLDLPPLDSKIIAGITMRGTNPIFYKIKVTNALVASIKYGTYPQEATTVHAHKPKIPRPNRRWIEGMQPLDNRLAIMSCYEAFKQFVN